MAKIRNSRKNTCTVLLTSLLVPCLLLCALILSAVGTAGKTWTHRVEFALAGDGVECKGINHRGPFQYCFLEERDDIDTPPTTTTEETETGTPTASSANTRLCPTSQADSRYRQRCTRTNNPNGVCPNFPRNEETITRNPSTNDSTPFCQQLNISAALLIAGCALIGIGLLASFVLCGTSLMQIFGDLGNNPRVTPSDGMLSLAASIVTGLGSLAMLFGTIIGANVLVNLQFPAGLWYGGSADALNASLEGPWLIGRSVGIATAGWVCAAVAASLIGKVWPASPVLTQQLCLDDVQVEEVSQRSKGRNVE